MDKDLMKQIMTEIETLEHQLHSPELKRGESAQLMMKIKRLRKRLNKFCLINGAPILKDYNSDITNSMFDE